MNRNPSPSTRGILVRLGFALLTGTAFVHGHSVWIEPLPDGGLVVRFAEPDGRLEKSPGHLDRLSIPVAFAVTNGLPQPVVAVKSTNHFRLVEAWSTNSACVETSFDVLSGRGKPGRRPNFYARWQPLAGGAGTPALTLDLVPTGRPGEARVWFRGKPLPGIQATLRTPDERERELVADAEGLLRFEVVQRGQYLLTVAHHRESLPGFAGGLAYELLSHNAALTWREH